MGEITFYICRHGKTMMNTLNRVQGWCDSPLTEEGKEVAEYLGYGLKDIDFRTAYCSDLNRTKETAEIVLDKAEQKHISIIELEGFKEACFGEYESSDDDLLWKFIAFYLQYNSVEAMDEGLEKGEIDYSNIQNTIAQIDSMGIAEDYKTLEARTQNALKKVAEIETEKGDGNILIISHAQAIAAMLLSLGGDKIIEGDLKNASVCKVTYHKGEFKVLSMGDLSYVQKGKLAK